VAARTAGIVADIELWCDPDAERGAFVEWQKRYRVTLKRQDGNELGARMQHALASALAIRRPALLIGTDCPGLDTTYLARADVARFNSSHRRPMRRAFPWRRRPAESPLDPRRS